MNDEDLDRLADYAAGLLDPDQAAEVDRLVATDPTWSRAYAELDAAAPRLDAALSGLGPTRIPTDVAERLAAVLALQTPLEGARTTNVIDLSARRRWARRAAGLTAAAAVLAAVFGGITALSTGANHDRDSATSAVGAGSGFRNGSAPLSATAAPIVRGSDVDYNPATLRALGAATSEHADAMAPDPSRTGDRSAAKQGAAPVPATPPQIPAHPPVSAPGLGVPPASAPGLSRLLAPDALSGCLSAVTSRYGGRPVLVEYARYLGTPAVIVLLDLGRTRRVVVVGPDCGVPGAGPDERFTLVE